MNNFWTNKVDKALRLMGYDNVLIQHFSSREKMELIIDQYLYYISRCDDDIGIPSLEDMAEFIIQTKSRS